MPKNQDGQVELVLENRQLLLIFFVIVVLCGIFFSLGYIVGRNTFASARVTQAAPASPETGNKPSPMPPAAYANPNPPNPPETAASPEQPPPATDLNFYQSGEQKPAEEKLLPPQNPSTPAPAPASAPPRPAAAEKQPPPESPAGILIQVSALSRREDADALVALLKSSKLPVMVTGAANDTLFHVVVGPYKTEKDAQAAKTALEADGFRPIIRR